MSSGKVVSPLTIFMDANCEYKLYVYLYIIHCCILYSLCIFLLLIIPSKTVLLISRIAVLVLY